jgi:cytochrome c556
MKARLLLLAATVLFTNAHAANAPATAPNLHDLMKNVVAVQAQIIWDVGNQAQDDKGDPDPRKLKPTDWSKLTAASGKVKQAMQTLAQAPHVMAAAPGQKLDGEGDPGTFGAKQVQAAIDANPELFRAFSQALIASMERISAAAQTKNATQLFDASGGLDQICEDCHVKFRDPEQKAAAR